jgi:hypothetical protein
MINYLWNNDLIQFARLLSEINATQSDLDMTALEEAMDLDAATIGEIFDRANTVFTLQLTERPVEPDDWF